jgi:hypothetical protein
VAFLDRVDERNAAESKSKGTAAHAITAFADMDETEFKQMYLGFKELSATDTEAMLAGES